MKIIIVDDEILVRLGIKTYLEKYEDIEVVKTFSTPQNALEYMEQAPVDIVLTDIEMAQMNGLDYIKALKTRNCNCGIIILSCHEKFEYVRAAMELGVDKYILKHEVDEESLVKEIRKIYSLIKGNQTIFFHKEGPVHINDDQNKMYCVAALAICEKDYNENDYFVFEQSLNIDKNMFFEILKMALDAYKEIKFFKNDKEEMFMVFEFLPIEKEEYENKKIHEIYYRLNQNTQLYINRSLVMGVSPSFNNHYEVDTYYEKAYRALCQKFYETSNVIFYHETEKNTFKLILDIKWLVEKNGEEKFYDSIKSYLESCKRKYITPDEVKGKILKKFHLYIEETVKMEYLENKKDEIMQYDLSYEEVQQIKTAKSLLFITLKHFKQLKNKLNEELQERDTFYSVLNYIDQHYNEQLSLADVAAQKFMSVNYFCQIFKKHTGTTFVNYINQKRVNEVKLLLKEEKLTLEQISQKTGFYNVNYMVRLFKKTTGFTIREYRKTLKK